MYIRHKRVFVADDGTEFQSIEECSEYEKKSKPNAEGIETVNGPLPFYLMETGSFVCDPNPKWYRPRLLSEAVQLCKKYKLRVEPDRIVGEWVCVAEADYGGYLFVTKRDEIFAVETYMKELNNLLDR